MSEVAQIVTRWHICDPKPAHCSGCWRSAGPDVTFYTPDSALDRGAIVSDDGARAVLDSIDWLNLCAVHDETTGKLIGGCVKEMLDVAHYQAEFHSQQLEEIRRLTGVARHWEQYGKKLEQAIAERPESKRR